MPFRLTALAMPLGLLLLARRIPSPIAAFRRAGAHSPETARKPASLGLSGVWLFENHIKSGLVVAIGDGRYYLNPARDARRRRLFWTAIGATATLMTAAIIWWELAS